MALPPAQSFEAARARIAPHVRRTSVARLRAGRVPPLGAGDLARGILEAPVASARLTRDLLLKLESEQITGSFKTRGALSRVLSLAPAAASRGIVTASGGNHGLAVAYAGHVIGAPTTVYLPGRTPASKAERIERWGARVVRAGDVWDDAHAAALEHAARGALAYVHPFADPEVVHGQGTVALEILEQAPEVDLVVVAIGGGGLAAGVAAALRALSPAVRVVGVEPVGAPTLTESLRAGHVVELAEIRTAASTLAPRRSDPLVFDIIRETVEAIVLVTDEEMKDAARFLLQELGVGAELSGAATLAAFLSGRIDPYLASAKHPLAIVCGAGSDAL